MEALETQAQATQEKENAVTKQNMKYTMSSSRGIYIFFICLAVDFLFFQSWNDCICFSVYMGRLKP